jgi:hypothetical protein
VTRTPAASRWPSPALLVAAAIGAVLLAVVAATAWPSVGDEHAYWAAAERLLAGRPIYDLDLPVNTPYAYWYPPVLAQVLAPFTPVVPDEVFTAAWTILLVACVWFLSGRNLLVALACVAFLPVALELRVRNVHLVIAVLAVLALRRSWAFWIPAAALKLAPVLGVLYLLAAGRRREAVLVAVAGGLVAAVSIALAPDAWAQFAQVVVARAPTDAGGFIPIPYPVRLAAAAIVAVVAGRAGGRRGEVGIVVAITVASPTLWANAFSQLLAILPLVRGGQPGGERGGGMRGDDPPMSRG